VAIVLGIAVTSVGVYIVSNEKEKWAVSHRRSDKKSDIKSAAIHDLPGRVVASISTDDCQSQQSSHRNSSLQRGCSNYLSFDQDVH
jgi:hypothetical protein